MVLSVVSGSYMGLTRSGTSRLGISDTNNTVAQRLLQQSGVARRLYYGLSGSIPGVIGYTILKYIQRRKSRRVVRSNDLVMCQECISIWFECRSGGRSLLVTMDPKHNRMRPTIDEGLRH